MENNVVIYQSNDGLVKMEAIVDASNVTIWATQKAMAHLLGVYRSVITRHLSNIFKEEELDKKVLLERDIGVHETSIYEIGVNVGCKLIICRYLPSLT